MTLWARSKVGRLAPDPPAFCSHKFRPRLKFFLFLASAPHSHIPSNPPPENVEGSCWPQIDDVIWQRAISRRNQQSVIRRLREDGSGKGAVSGGRGLHHRPHRHGRYGQDVCPDAEQRWMEVIFACLVPVDTNPPLPSAPFPPGKSHFPLVGRPSPPQHTIPHPLHDDLSAFG